VHHQIWFGGHLIPGLKGWFAVELGVVFCKKKKEAGCEKTERMKMQR